MFAAAVMATAYLAQHTLWQWAGAYAGPHWVRFLLKLVLAGIMASSILVVMVAVLCLGLMVFLVPAY